MYLLYFVLWVIFNGRITLEICLFGIVISSLIFAFVCKFMDYSIEKEKKLWRNMLRIVKYCITLVLEIMKANMAVIHMILTQKEEPQPALVSFQAEMKTSLGKAALANAITLTPGTITVSLEKEEYIVHCLDESYAEGIDRSVFVELLSEIEEK